MPAPRLLDKKVITATLSTERKQEIDRGKRLVESIEALEDAKAKEEKELQDFRVSHIQVIQAEIDEKIRENESLGQANIRLREERIRLSAPVDLQQAWEEIRVGKEEISEWKEKLTIQSVKQLAQEQRSNEASEESKRLWTEALNAKELSTKTLKEAEFKHEESILLLEKSQVESRRILADAKSEEARMTDIRIDLNERDASVSRREQVNDAHEIDLATREQALKERHEIQTNDVFTREKDLLEASKDIERKNKEIEEKEIIVQTRLQLANKEHKESNLVLEKATHKAKEILEKATFREKQLREFESNLAIETSNLTERESKNQRQELELHDREQKVNLLVEGFESKTIELGKQEKEIQQEKEHLAFLVKETKKSEMAIEENLRQAEEQRNEATSTNKEAQLLLSETKEAQKALHTRLKEMEKRELASSLREEQLEKETLDINNQKILLADRRATLEQGFADLRRRQANK